MNATTQKALNILNNQDWYYFMADGSYETAKRKAYNNMRYFVNTLAEVQEEKVKQALIDLWMLNYWDVRKKYTTEEFTSMKAQYLNIIEA